MIEFKNKRDEKLLYMVNPLLFLIVADSALFFHNHNKNFVITSTLSTKESDKALGRVSKTHQEGRAVDVRINNLDQEFIDRWVDYIQSKYEEHAAKNLSGENKLIVLHGTGANFHAHIQINKRYAN